MITHINVLLGNQFQNVVCQIGKLDTHILHFNSGRIRYLLYGDNRFIILWPFTAWRSPRSIRIKSQIQHTPWCEQQAAEQLDFLSGLNLWLKITPMPFLSGTDASENLGKIADFKAYAKSQQFWVKERRGTFTGQCNEMFYIIKNAT